MQIDWVQIRRVAMGAGFGLLVGGIAIPMLFPQYQDRIVTEFSETVKTVEKEKIVIQEKEVIVWKDKIIKVNERSKTKETIYSRDGGVRIIERESLITQDTMQSSGIISNEASMQKNTEKTSDASSTLKTTVQTEKPSFGLGLTTKLSIPYTFDYKDITIHGYANVAKSGFWLHGSYAYPLTFSIGGLYLW